MIETQFEPKPYTKKIKSGAFTWSAPSNIALVKYWGKKAHQIPQNPSISFTLNNCKTTTTLHFSEKENEDEFSFEVYLDGVLNEGFRPKIELFFNRIAVYLPFLKSYHFKIETSNTFPHSSGIASSASGMSALALCLMSIEKNVSETMTESFFIKKASFLARLGSGSACRSIEGDIVVWGSHHKVGGSSDLFGVKYPNNIHINFKGYQDTILLVDKGEKQVSSTIGHDLMHNHPYAGQRFEQADTHLTKLVDVFESGNLDDFIAIVESEALTLHAMMMTSMPYFILMKPNTLNIINAIWKFREETNSKICFTLDAGANVHVLFPKQEKNIIADFIRNKLAQYCQNGQFIEDEIGFGALQLSN